MTAVWFSYKNPWFNEKLVARVTFDDFDVTIEILIPAFNGFVTLYYHWITNTEMNVTKFDKYFNWA